MKASETREQIARVLYGDDEIWPEALAYYNEWVAKDIRVAPDGVRKAFEKADTILALPWPRSTVKDAAPTVQRANIACPSCGQRIDFSLSEPAKDAAPAPVLTEQEIINALLPVRVSWHEARQDAQIILNLQKEKSARRPRAGDAIMQDMGVEP